MKGRVAALCFFWATAAWGQVPDPRDSIILESKTVLPGVSRPAFTMKVYITNKDSLTDLVLALTKGRISGGADIFTPRTCCPYNYLNFLTNTLRYRGACIPECNTDPFEYTDTLASLVMWDLFDASTLEPPNAVRKALLEIKFDSVLSYPGIIEFDSARVLGTLVTSFSNVRSQVLPVNFVKSIITVMPKGDFNLDGSLSSADVVELLNSVFLMEMQPSGVYPFDLNCDGARSPADAVWELYAVFLGRPFPC